jgi:hypothetical protein
MLVNVIWNTTPSNFRIKNRRYVCKISHDLSVPEPSDYQSGKCSHGGLGDHSSKIPARGGINKERFNVTFSPHYYLHPQASEAAVIATDFFISANNSGTNDA